MQLALDAVGLLMSAIVTVMAIRLVIRTEKELDIAAKLMLGIAIIMVVANLAFANYHLSGVVSAEIITAIFNFARILGMGLFMGVVYFLLKITDKEK